MKRQDAHGKARVGGMGCRAPLGSSQVVTGLNVAGGRDLHKSCWAALRGGGAGRQEVSIIPDFRTPWGTQHGV